MEEALRDSSQADSEKRGVVPLAPSFSSVGTYDASNNTDFADRRDVSHSRGEQHNGRVSTIVQRGKRAILHLYLGCRDFVAFIPRSEAIVKRYRERTEERERAFFIVQRKEHYANLNREVFKKLEGLTLEISPNPFIETLKDLKSRVKGLEKMSAKEREVAVRRWTNDKEFSGSFPQLSIIPFESLMATRTPYMEDAEKHLAAHWPALPGGIRETISRMNAHNEKVLSYEFEFSRRMTDGVKSIVPDNDKGTSGHISLALWMAIETEIVAKIRPDYVPLSKKVVPLSEWSKSDGINLPEETERGLMAFAQGVVDDAQTNEKIRSFFDERTEIVERMVAIAQHAGGISYAIESGHYDMVCECCPK